MAGSAREELSALAAIFCGPGEWEVLSCSETDGAVFRILTEARGLTEADVPLELVFHLPVGYPSCLPGISVRSERLTRAQRAAVREALLEQARSLLSEPMVHQLVLWAQQNLRHILAQPGSGGGPGEGPSEAPSGSGDEGPWLALLHLDHMRAKTRYVRAVRQWASALGLTGRLLFAGKEYLVLQKTSKVDVDSSGQKCKERMVSVLFERKVQPGDTRFPAFEVKEFSSLDALQKEFETAGLERLFHEFVPGLVK
ncbi:RWD domain-containing protein 3 isoform X2 [Saccopteryx leptura]|uniref:RWD domain-containing protein 3 isoform X2 n=1 Tax=Saccopteryx leptura TaxID=249018 RepID=UPI00339BF235